MTQILQELHHYTGFEMGQTVYLKTDPDQMAGIITAFAVNPSSVSIKISRDTMDSWHWPIELSHEKDLLATL